MRIAAMRKPAVWRVFQIGGWGSALLIALRVAMLVLARRIIRHLLLLLTALVGLLTALLILPRFALILLLLLVLLVLIAILHRLSLHAFQPLGIIRRAEWGSCGRKVTRALLRRCERRRFAGIWRNQ